MNLHFAGPIVRLFLRDLVAGFSILDADGALMNRVVADEFGIVLAEFVVKVIAVLNADKLIAELLTIFTSHVVVSSFKYAVRWPTPLSLFEDLALSPG